MKKWTKKLGLMVLVMLTLSIMLSTMASASSGIKVMVNGELVQFDVQPQVINDRTMVPLRAIFEKLGAEVDWNGQTQTVTATRDDIVVVSTIGSRTMYINGEAKTMDVAPSVINGRTLVPVRFVAEAFDCYVEWDGSSSTVYITSDYDTDNSGTSSGDPSSDDGGDSPDNPGFAGGYTEDEIYDMYA